MSEAPAEWVVLQQRLAASVEIPATMPDVPQPAQVLALDVQYGEAVAHVGASLHRGDGVGLGTFRGQSRVEAPYVPGYFCFREGPPLLALVRRLLEKGLAEPELLLVDGHGIAHPRRLGVACWLGLATGIPTVGCAKETLLRYEGEPDVWRGSAAPLVYEGEQRGWILRTQESVRPVFVSPGHLVSLDAARSAVLGLGGSYRIPDPLRFADQCARGRARGDASDEVHELGPLERARAPARAATPRTRSTSWARSSARARPGKRRNPRDLPPRIFPGWRRPRAALGRQREASWKP